MKKLIFLIALIPAMVLAQTPDPVLLTTTEITVKQGHRAQFEEGVKKWKECYLDNEGKENWNFWRRMQGEGNVYVMSGSMSNWAEMDKEDPAGEGCANVLLNFIMPHVDKVAYGISRSMPEFSRVMPEDTKLVWVTFFRVKDDTAFREIITAVSSAIKAKEGDYRGMWYNYMGGAVDAADYMVSTPYNGFAQLDIVRDSPSKVYENAVGKKKADEMGAKWDAAVDDGWSYIYTLNSELSN
ncbi:hypothetical protein FHG64_06520 [Antarcticibacterium flavum]|uniref:Uncharacterized protein n=1 Tax=Antarcticibacterium flavum TaxID=2058175 RepID=A0A5B7X377_9FLAO|nr:MULTISPECIES: hypothetical protein [Antarcticibacterium]MCM4161307.1 hypothetical protein [Antarcticibacterium sp. W02-3]QCY69088.1 hypothetical protein FHG64_06520 [Antarcticibacterium flavum]